MLFSCVNKVNEKFVNSVRWLGVGLALSYSF